MGSFEALPGLDRFPPFSRLQLALESGRDVSVCVLEKGSEIGAHELSGNVFDPRALSELIPDWKEDPTCPVGRAPVVKERIHFLFESFALPIPPVGPMGNHGNYVVSLSQVTRWLAERAEELGVDVFPGFSAAKLLLAPVGEASKASGAAPPSGSEPRSPVLGVATTDAGLDAQSRPKEGEYAPGVAIRARATLLAEGCRGSLSRALVESFGLAEGRDPPTYGLGIKEVWEPSPDNPATPGSVVHSVGYPLRWSEYGGGFAYAMADGKIAIGLVVALDYADPYLSPFQEFQKMKKHPVYAKLIEGGQCIQYGARTVTEGGLQSLPRLAVPGAALLGDAAGFLNVPRVKGAHTAIKSGMLAAEAFVRALEADEDQAGAADEGAAISASSSAAPEEGASSSPAFLATFADPDESSSPGSPLFLSSYEPSFRASWMHDELHRVRNFRPGFSTKGGLLVGLANAGWETVTMGHSPWTLRRSHTDGQATEDASKFKPRNYPKPDGRLTFDLPTSVFRSGTNHDHDQPCHLRLENPAVPVEVNLKKYAGPEQRYCPAGVYEFVDDVAAQGTQQEMSAPADIAEQETSAPAGGASPPCAAKKTRLQINAQNCVHCKACDIKDPTGNIRWTPPQGGGGPTYTVM